MKKFISYLSLMGAFSLQADKAVLPEKNFDFLANYCLNCHGEEKQEGKVNLEDLDFNIQNLKDAETWQKVLHSINAGEMPPEDKKQPNNQEKADFLDDLSKTMVVARKALSDSGGNITMSRLNRREYQNTIKALTGTTVDVELLPTDESAGRFDTVGSSLFISSDQFKEYLKLGRLAIDEMFARQSNSASKVYRVEPEKVYNPQADKLIKGATYRQEQFRKWQVGVDKAAKDPQNKEIVDKILGKKKANARTLYSSANLLKGAPNPKDYGFKDAQAASSAHPSIDRANLALYKHFASLPQRDNGLYLMKAHGIGRIDIGSKNLQPGKYTLRIRAAALDDAPAERRFIDIGHPQVETGQQRGLLSGAPIATRYVNGTMDSPEIIEVPIEIGMNTTKEFAVQEKQHNDNLKAAWGIHIVEKKKNGYGIAPAIWVDWLELVGPHKEENSNYMDWWLEAQEGVSESDRAKKIFLRFIYKAFRGQKPGKDYFYALVKLFEKNRAAGDAFDVAIREPLSIILASPGFLYLNEPSVEKGRRKLNDRELAIRLAYFLWSSPPDRELMSLAAKKQLSNPEVLNKQVARLIADPRANKFVSGFLHQWLDMERLDFFQFDTTVYSEFDEATREASRKEVYESFAYLMRHKSEGQIAKLLNSDYVIINPLMASFYGIEGVTGNEYRKVSLPQGSSRGGLLGMAAINAMGSDGIESSPVERGAWVLRHLLNEPPPPAPANVPQLSDVKGENLTTRQKLLAHQAEPQCASCHRKIDPIGFGLENFDPIGKWRDKEFAIKHGKYKRKSKDGHQIDTSGALHKGPQFANYFELREIIAKREADFAKGFTEHLIEYALGRPFGFTDEDLVNKVLASAKENDYQVSSFIAALVSSEAFKQK